MITGSTGQIMSIRTKPMRLAAATAESGCCNSLVGAFAAWNHDARVWTLRSKGLPITASKGDRSDSQGTKMDKPQNAET